MGRNATFSNAAFSRALQARLGTPQFERQYINLKQRFPLSLRGSLKVGAPWAFASLICILGIVYAPSGAESDGTEELSSVLHELLALAAVGFFLVSAGRIAVDIISRYSYRYEIVENVVNISRGLLFRTSCSFPLSRITEVYISRGVLDLIFGLCNLQVETSTSTAQLFARIDGLSRQRAEELKELLLRLSGLNPDTMTSRPTFPLAQPFEVGSNWGYERVTRAA